MDCVYQAYCDWLEYKGETPNLMDYTMYYTLKWWLQGPRPQYTFGGVIPWLLRNLMMLHEYNWLEVQYRIYTPDHLFEVATKEYASGYVKAMQNAFVYLRKTGNEVDKIYLIDSIYLLLNSQHAVFAHQVPMFGTPVMAIKGHKDWRYK